MRITASALQPLHVTRRRLGRSTAPAGSAPTRGRPGELGAHRSARDSAADRVLHALELYQSELRNRVQRPGDGGQGDARRLLVVASANLEALEMNLRAFRSGRDDIALERAVRRMITRQSVYAAAG